MLERYILQGCIQLLEAEGWNVHRLQSGIVQRPGSQARFTVGERGVPDLLAMKAGYEPKYIECKTARGKLSPAQALWHAKAARRGFTVHVIRDVDELKTVLAKARRCA